MGITGYNYNLNNGSTHSFYTDNSGPSGASGASGSYGANLASGIYQVSGAHVVSGMSGVGSISNLAFSQIIDMFEKGNLVTSELVKGLRSKGVTPKIETNGNLTKATFTYQGKNYVIQCNKEYAEHQIDTKTATTYTVAQMRSYGFDADTIAKYFDVAESQNGVATKYVLKKGQYADAGSLKNALFSSTRNTLILNNFVYNNKNLTSRLYLEFTKTSDNKTLTNANFMTYKAQIEAASGGDINKLKQEALDKFVKEFAQGNVGYLQVSTILNAIGITGRDTQTINGNYEISFNFNNKQYKVICNKALAAYGNDDKKIATYTPEELTEMGVTPELKDKFFNAAGTVNGVATVLTLKDGVTIEDVKAELNASKEALTNTFKKFASGNQTVEDFVAELNKMGATNIEVKDSTETAYAEAGEYKRVHFVLDGVSYRVSCEAVACESSNDNITREVYTYGELVGFGLANAFFDEYADTAIAITSNNGTDTIDRYFVLRDGITIDDIISGYQSDQNNSDFINSWAEFVSSGDFGTCIDYLRNEIEFSQDELLSMYSKVDELYNDVFVQGAPGFTKGEQDAIYDAIRLIINSLNADQKKELALDMPGFVGPYAIKNGINSLTKQEIIELINQFIIANPQLLVTDHNELSTLFDLNIKATISAGIIYGDENLFIKHIFSGNSLDELIQLMNDAKLDAGLITDFTGIYALASSMGIEAGLFLPDNISLIDLDKYYTNEDGILVNDPEWRGGTYEEPNAYTEGVRSVNYKVYYEMKQLKKSIATIIFKMELTDDDNELAVDNNVETDYFCNVKEKDENGNLVVDEYGNHIILNEVYFYIPINNDILYKDYLYINMTKGTYELSYGAKFDEGTDKFEIELPKENYFVGQILYDTFIVEAEDEKVKTKYTLYVTITNPAYLDPLNSVTVDGVASATTISTKSGLKGETVTDAIVNTAVVGYNGKIVLNYGTVNMTNGLSLLSNVNVYKTNLSVLPTALPTNYSSYTTNKLIKGTDYVFNDVVNNGIVVITGVSGTGFENNSYPDGTIFFDISLDNYQSAGIYLIEIEINDDAKYYTFFEKAKSSMANLESLTFDGQYYVNESNSNDNSDAPSLLQFGTPVTEEFFANSGVLNNNLYIDSIEGVLNGDFFNTDANKVCIYKKGDSNITNANQSYRIAIKLNPLNNKYEITNKYTSGDGQDVTTLDFDYLIMIPSSHVDRVTFNNVAIGDICDISNSGTTCNITFNKGLYLDSILTSPLSTFTIGEVTATKVGELYQYTVEIKIIAEDGTPKTFTHYINEETYNDYITRIYVNGGVEVDDIIGDDAAEQAATYAYEDTFEKTETPSYRFEYSLDHFYTLPTSSYFKVQFYDASGNELTDIPTGVTVNVTEGLDFEVEFSEDAESTDYYFAMVYQNSVEFNDTQTNGWDVEFKKIHIKKQKSRNSYLDNITFFSESVTASIRTMITADVITLTEYEAMLKDSTREIVCLPGQIYYNDYAWSYSDNTMEKESDFYVIGLVNRTELDYYTPDFTLPEGATVYRTETVEGAIYKYVPYYVDDLQALTNFLISEDGNTILDEGGNAITVTNASTGFSSFTYNGINYTISPVAGYQSIVYNETTIENTSLRTNYNEFGSYDEDAEEFNFVNYRVYAEIYSELTTDADKANHVTDYKVAAQDLTNNIRFNLTIQYADGCDINEKVKNIFVEFVCYALPAEVTKENPDRSEYLLYNKAGIFAYFDGDNILSHGSLKSNTSGYYDLFISLPDGYKASFTVTDKKVTTTYTDTNEFFVDTGITVRNVDIVITIDKVDNYTPEWGVHVKNESNSK